MTLQSGSPRRSERPEEEREAAVRRDAPDEVQRVLALQRTAGNQAVGAELQRKTNDGGSIALLSGVPQSVVTDWKAKVTAYRKLLRGK